MQVACLDFEKKRVPILTNAMSAKTINMQGISIQELKQILRDTIRIELQIFGKSFLKNSECDFLTRKQTAILLQIDLSTLYDWTKAGKLDCKKVGRRVYYLKVDIENLLKSN